MIKEKTQNIKVIARFRPLISLELELGEAKINWFSMPNEKTISVNKDSVPENFTFDGVFSVDTQQTEIFESLGRPIVEDVLSGYNGTVLAYGQTGSGKTFTMMGSDIFDPSLRGLIPRAVSLIFDSLSIQSPDIECTIKCSMLEIYKENLQDLLVRGPKLKIKENKSKGLYVDGLSEIYVVCEEEILNAIAIGEKNRSIACTKMNQQSSRSHQIFMIEVGQKLPNGSFKRGVLNLVDLAGCEKVNQTGATGEKLEEAKKINLSLSALGNVIKALTSGADHIPYRDSKLTRLLQESLGGNYKTSLVVNCSPHPRNIEDSINTLKFAQRAKTIKNSAKANVTLSVEAYIKTIADLKVQLQVAQLEVIRLQKAIKENSYEQSTPSNSSVQPADDNQLLQLNGQISDLNSQLIEFKEQIKIMEAEKTEFDLNAKDLEHKLSQERLKKLQSDEKVQTLTQQLEILQIQLNEKQGSEARLSSENKKLESQLFYLAQVVKDLSLKFSDQLNKLRHNQDLTLSDYFLKAAENFDLNSNDSTISFKKYFPESLKMADFLQTYQQFVVPNELTLRERLLRSEIATCELSNMHWTLFCKYQILRQQYSSLFSIFDLQKKTLSSFKNLVKSMQEMYTDMFAKVYKYSMNAVVSSVTRMRRPVNNALPACFEGNSGPNKEFLRRASLFHMVSSGFNVGPEMLDPKQESLLIKNIENKLEVQNLLNNQLKITAKSLKEENFQINSLLESLSFNQNKFENHLIEKLSYSLKELSNFFSNRGKGEGEVVENSKHFARATSLKLIPEEDMGPVESVRKKEKNFTVMPQNIMMNMKSSLSKNFIKALPSPIVKKEGDSSPIFPDRRSL